MKKILIVEDDKKIAQLEQAYLEMSGYETFCVYDGADVEVEAEKNQYDLILLDLMLPNCSGHTICENLRKKTDIPILMVTALGESVDVIRGLGLGADDYITKPFNPLELVARVKSSLRRYTMLGSCAGTKKNYVVGSLEIDDEAKIVTVDGEQVRLTPIEYQILLLLVQNPGRVFSTQQIYENIWNEEAYGAENTVAVHIRHIREKIEINPKEPRYLKVVWGVGYKIEK